MPGKVTRRGRVIHPLSTIVAELRFPFSWKWTRENFDDPRVRCRWRLAMGVSMGV
jgi:hypothetical protein